MLDLAIIPARGGSQGLPGKNIADLGGFPLIAWTVKAAISSKIFKQVIVSTDSQEIANVAAKAGASIPFIRPPELATAKARSVDVISHAVRSIQPCKSFALLQPTSPFRNAQHIIKATKQYLTSNSTSLVSIIPAKPLDWHYSIDDRQFLHPVTPMDHTRASRRQDALPTFVLNGAIYICSTEVFSASKSLICETTAGYAMSEIDSLDIDYADDLQLARAIVASGLRSIDK